MLGTTALLELLVLHLDQIHIVDKKMQPVVLWLHPLRYLPFDLHGISMYILDQF